MYSQLLASKSSHKDVDRSAFFLLRLYYTNRIFMGVCCVSAEVLYLCALAASDEKGVGAVAGVPALVAILPASVGVPGTTPRDGAQDGRRGGSDRDPRAPRVGAQADRERRAAQGGERRRAREARREGATENAVTTSASEPLTSAVGERPNEFVRGGSGRGECRVISERARERRRRTGLRAGCSSFVKIVFHRVVRAFVHAVSAPARESSPRPPRDAVFARRRV